MRRCRRKVLPRNPHSRHATESGCTDRRIETAGANFSSAPTGAGAFVPKPAQRLMHRRDQSSELIDGDAILLDITAHDLGNQIRIDCL